MANIGTCWKSKCGLIELRCGDYREVLADVVGARAILTDPPYSDRVHSGQRTGSRPSGGGGRKPTIQYGSIDESWCSDLSSFIVESGAFWSAVFSDHQAQRWHESALTNLGLYVFAPVIWLRENPTPRLSGDGPTSACDYITVARQRKRPEGDFGSRPGYYIVEANANAWLPGAKPLSGMRALVRDYSKPGDLIVDPCAGSGTTLLAAAMEGRRAIGAELDPKTFDLAVKRLSAGYTSDLFGGE